MDYNNWIKSESYKEEKKRWKAGKAQAQSEKTLMWLLDYFEPWP